MAGCTRAHPRGDWFAGGAMASLPRGCERGNVPGVGCGQVAKPGRGEYAPREVRSGDRFAEAVSRVGV